MTADHAATLLNAKLRPSSWLTAVGVGRHDGAEAIYVYFKTRPQPREVEFLSQGWFGYTVILTKMGSAKPAQVFPPATQRKHVKVRLG
jgi:hypothetical protein